MVVKSSKSWMIVLAGCVAPCLAACNVQRVGGDTGGVSLDGGSDAGSEVAARGAVVVSTDYTGSSVVSLLSPRGDVLSPAFIGSGSAPPGLSAAFGGDVIPPTMRLPGDEIVLIASGDTSVLSWVNLETVAVRQLSVRTGFYANPHDYVPYSESKAFVTRYEPNRDAGKEPFDAGDDLLVVDPSRPAITGSIDLKPVMEGAPEGFHPRADRALMAGGKLRLSTNAMNAGFKAIVDSRIVTVDPESEAITHVLILPGMTNCSRLAPSPDGRQLAVACRGLYYQDPALGFPDSGVVILDVGDALSEVRRFTARDFGTEQITGAEWTSESTLLVSITGRLDPDRLNVVSRDALRFLDLEAGTLERTPLLESQDEAFVFGGAQCDLHARTCFATDAERGVVHLLTIGEAGRPAVERAIRIDTGTGLPPRYLGRF